MSPLEHKLVTNMAVRLIRGTAGSGKTLVLTRRAQYLSAQQPAWRLCVLTFNNALAHSLEASLHGFSNVKVSTFHSLCKGLLKGYTDYKPQDVAGWLRANLRHFPAGADMGSEFVEQEIRWIKDMGFADRAMYLEAERHGRGRPLSQAQRQMLYDVVEAYHKYLAKQGFCDWGDIPYLVLQGMQEGRIQTGMYDAILIDEAQDFAPVWLKVVKYLINPESGLLFLCDDPSQSIYRYYSWQEKGIPVVGRTRWLRIPYRNTREIYQAAYEVIRRDEVLQKQLEQELGSAVVQPDIANSFVRSGPRPEVRCYANFDSEMLFVEAEIRRLLQDGVPAAQIAVLHRRTSGKNRLQQKLRGLGVHIDTFHGPKGLEFDVVFMTEMHETFNLGGEPTPEELSEERRLVYMAMTRPRQRLCMTYIGRWPEPLRDVLAYVDHIDCR